MKITFLMNAFNSLTIFPKGMFKANIEHIAHIADQIIMIEGANDPPAKSFSKDGHSTDDTVKVIKELQQKYPQIELIQHPNGFWPYGVDTRLKAADKIMTGDYTWLIDSDEFYHEKDIPVILRLLEERQPYMMEFHANYFWGDWNHVITDGTAHLWSGELPWMRIFKNCPGESYWHGYQPPEMWYKKDVMCNQQKNIITQDQTRDMGIKMFHYSFVSQSQLDFKKVFYEKSGVDYERHWDEWQKDHLVPIVLGTKTKEFDSERHPAVIKRLIEDA